MTEMKAVKPMSRWKVYTWENWRKPVTKRKGRNNNHQARDYAMAPSKAAIVRAMDMRYVTLTGVRLAVKDSHIEAARAHPGKIIWRSLDDDMRDIGDWQVDKPRVAFDVPFPKRVESVDVELWIVSRGGCFVRDGDKPQLHSVTARKHENHYSAKRIKGERGSDAHSAFGFRTKLPLSQYTAPDDAIAGYLRDQEDDIETAKKEIEQAEANIANATMLYLREPEGAQK